MTVNVRRKRGRYDAIVTEGRERLRHEIVRRQRAENLDRVAGSPCCRRGHDGFRNAGDLVPPGEIRKLRRLDGEGRDVGVGERHLVRHAHGARTVRTGRRREHPHGDRRRHGRDAREALRGQRRRPRRRRAARPESATRTRSPTARRENGSSSRARRPIRPGRRSPRPARDRLSYCFALSGSRTKLISSIVIWSDSSGSSSRIWRVCRHVSQPSVCVKNSSRTGRVMPAKRSRSRS